tara:strand:- start:4082 stop:4201 length:120 start_codon:yes stop_codon:yes gene_type:complete
MAFFKIKRTSTTVQEMPPLLNCEVFMGYNVVFGGYGCTT